MIEETTTTFDTRSRLRSRQRFAACVATTDAELDLADASLWIAAEEYPHLDPQVYLGRLESLAERVRGARRRRPGTYVALDALRSVLVEEQQFGGNADHYYDPRNSFLNEVLDRRVGIPISLSVLWLEVARRSGIAAEGVNMPGHFLVRLLDRHEPLLIDPFCDGMLLTPDACEDRLRQTHGDEMRLSVEDLAAASSKQILVRMLNNLRMIYLELEDHSRALAVVDRIVMLVGDSPKLRRDRGLLFSKLKIYGKAWADLSAYLRSDEVQQATDVEVSEEVTLLRDHLERVRRLAADPN